MKLDELDDIIMRILNNKDTDEKVYSDEPILFTASKMKNYTPPMYAKMRKIAQKYYSNYKADSQLFYEQAKFMEDFEDDFDYNGTFLCYYPTYQAMNNQQLRGYFSWRTLVRRGIVRQTSLSFVYVYMYEILNQIGVESAEDGFYKLEAIAESYGEFDSRIKFYAKRWLTDYAAYYNIPGEITSSCNLLKSEESLSVFVDVENHSDDEIFDALTSLSSYNLKGSAFYKKNPDDVKRAVLDVYSSLLKYYSSNHKYDLNEKLFGKRFTSAYFIFASAVFCERERHENCEYKINATSRLYCKDNSWTIEQFFYYKGKSKVLGGLLKNIDAKMRVEYGYKTTLKPVETTKIFESTIDNAVGTVRRKKIEAERPKIEIDVSKLQNIRDTSLVTQSKLIVDEEFEDEEVMEEIAPEQDNLLDDVQKGFIKCLADGGDINAYCRSKGVMTSVITDKINDLLFDEFGDTVIDFDGDMPVIIEDYIEDLKGMTE